MSLDTDGATAPTTDVTSTTRPPAAGEAFERLPLDLIVTSLTNRKSFDQAKLAELAESIRGIGVIQPILVRPLPASRVEETSNRTAPRDPREAWPFGKGKTLPRPTHEIVSGERRFLASRIAGLADIPAIVRELTDEQALEAQLVENLQRDDLHPLDEAEGYQRLCDATGISKKDIGAKIGRSRSYVYMRLQLLNLDPTARQVFREGHLDVSKAELLATIPHPPSQTKALREFMTLRADGRTMSYRDAATWVEQNVMLKLQHAPFDTQDFALLEGAGPCGECPKNTACERDLFATFNGPALCTDPGCYGKKASATIEALRRRAADQGLQIIVGAEAKRLMPSAHDKTIKGYTRLDDKIDGKRVDKLLGADAPQPILFADPHTRELVKVLPTDVVQRLTQPKPKAVGPREAARQEQQAAEPAAKPGAAAQRATAHQGGSTEDSADPQKIHDAWKMRTAVAVDGAIRAGAIKEFSADVLRALLLLAVDNDVLYHVAEPLLKLWKLPPDDDVEAVLRHIEAAPDTELGRLTFGFIMATELYLDHDKPTPRIDMVARQAGVDAAQILVDLQAEIAAQARADAAPPPGATDQAAPQAPQPAKGGKAAAKDKPAPKGKAAPPAKLSAQEAQLGIADAMQSVDATSGRPGKEARVEFLQDVRYLGKVRLVRGLTGTVLETVGDRALSIMVDGAKKPNPIVADYTEVKVLEPKGAEG